jgi:hypothetical protein
MYYVANHSFPMEAPTPHQEGYFFPETMRPETPIPGLIPARLPFDEN